MEDTAANTTETPEEQPAAPPADTTPPTANAPAEEGPEATESEAASAPEADGSPGADGSPAETLQPILERAGTGRLSPEDEAQAADALSALLLGRKEDLPTAIAAMPKVGWTASVKAVTAAWPEMKATAKTNFLKALGAEESEGGRRIRLSIARGLFKIPDLPACTKLIVGVAKEIRDKESGNVPPKDAQSFANVMIGKGKPWIAQLPLADLKPSEADLLVHCATLAAFSTNLPPITLVGLLRWAGEAGRLEALHESVSTLVAKSTARWSAKWAAALRKDVPGLPELIVAGLKPETVDAGGKPDLEEPGQTQEDDGLPAELKTAGGDSGSVPASSETAAGRHERHRPVYVSKTIPPKDQKPVAADRSQTPQPSAPQQGRTAGPAARSREFNVGDTLRQLDAHVAFLKGELKAAESKLRDREDDRSRQSRKKLDVPFIAGEPTPDELARLNLQLESRITELQSRIDDLTADAEARAVSAGAFAAAPETNPDAQLRTLLGLKLAEVYADFCALETEDRDLVVPQHYRTLANEVFEVLKAEHILLEQPAKE
jgi:hypothetical protein